MKANIIAIARRLTFEEVAEILTYAEEPELLIEAGEQPPVFAPDLVAAAHLASSWLETLLRLPVVGRLAN
ncbi:hypothetical protein MesoLjLc_51360 [Mesorhizobium sp. L-8-10]|uniref:hypothetical protein n=1 Tax=Mesorhizobium sp. L-8-10 TaxID=2744523 RepID=UPI001925B5FD|nr:hypothetical protein [Mesorhizobium sp. L-8-10]BCH33206.1 hypothetical protein MesoLjLc_51360 [Mesorhizobium sp. L-8-10]